MVGGSYKSSMKKKMSRAQRSSKSIQWPTRLSKHYRTRQVVAWQLQGVGMSTLSSTGSVVGSAGSVFSLLPAEHHQVREQDPYPLN